MIETQYCVTETPSSEVSIYILKKKKKKVGMEYQKAYKQEYKDGNKKVKGRPYSSL